MLSQGKGSRCSVAIVLTLNYCALAEYLTPAELRRMQKFPHWEERGGETQEVEKHLAERSCFSRPTDREVEDSSELRPAALDIQNGECMRVLCVLQK